MTEAVLEQLDKLNVVDLEPKDVGPRPLAERFAEALFLCEEEPGWENFSERDKTGWLLRHAGFLAKAERWWDCQVTSLPVDCGSCGEKWFSRYRCTLRNCPHCAKGHFKRLMDRYSQPIADLIAHQPTQRGRTLAKIDLTVRASGHIPDPDDAKRLNKLVKRWLKRVVPKGSFWGALFTIEVGHELAVKHPDRKASGWNLHVHVLYYGSFLDWEKGRVLWKKLTGGSWVCRMTQCLDWRRDFKTAVRRSLIHHLGYVLKPAGVSGERLAALEMLWTGVKRVHPVGEFYNLPKPLKKKSRSCPKCGANLPINLRAWRKSERFLTAELEAQGRRDIEGFPRGQKIPVEIAESLYRRAP